MGKLDHYYTTHSEEECDAKREKNHDLSIVMYHIQNTIEIVCFGVIIFNLFSITAYMIFI